MTEIPESGPEKKRDAVIDRLRSSQQGLSAGLAPYWIIWEKSGNLSWVPHLVMLGRSNRLTLADSSKVDFAQFVTAIGVAVGVGRASNEGSRPLNVALRATCSFFSKHSYRQVFGGDRDNLWGGEGSVLLPVSDTGSGILFEVAFSERFQPAWEAGLVFTKRKEGAATGSPAQTQTRAKN